MLRLIAWWFHLQRHWPRYRTHLITVMTWLLFLFTVIVGASTLAVAAVTITDLDAPSSAPSGDTVTVSASGSGDNGETTLTIKVFRMDTKAKLCEDTTDLPGTVSCSGSFTMPGDDVDIRTYIQVGGRITEDKYTTITATAPATPEPPDSGDDPNENDPSPSTTPDPNVRTPEPLPEAYQVNNSTGIIEPADSEDDPDGMLGGIIGGLTDTARDGFASVLNTFVSLTAFNLVQTLLKSVAAILAYTPRVHPNPAVAQIHQLTLAVTFSVVTFAVAATGLLYQLGPVLGLSYRDLRQVLPRIVIALAFSLVSLPLLQLSVDLANALTTAFRPALTQTTLGELVGTSTAVALGLLIEAVLLLGVAAAYLIADVYLLFVAAITPLIALAWALPRTRRYAAAFIGGWWTCLAMGPLAMLVLHFTFALMHGGATPLQGISNWLYGVVAFTLLLIIPYQLYGASQAVTAQAFQFSSSIEHRAKQTYRQHTRTDAADRQSRYGTTDTVNDDTPSPPDWWRDDAFDDEPGDP